MEYEFEKECINQMARSALRKYSQKFQGGQNLHQKYRVSIRIGHGFTYSKYNTLMHFLNAAEAYWHNPDLNNIQVFGKDIRALLAVSCQKIFFEEGHRFYHYGPIEVPTPTPALPPHPCCTHTRAAPTPVLPPHPCCRGTA